jgi:hypothetical protein
MNLNLSQRRTIAIGFLINALVGLFPPWVARFGAGESRQQLDVGVSFLFLPPRMPNLMKQLYGPEVATRVSQSGAEGYLAFIRGAFAVEINLKLLFVEWILVWFVVAAVAMWFGKKKPEMKNP